MEHTYKFDRNKDGKYETTEILSDTIEALDVGTYKQNLQNEIDNLNTKIDDLQRGVKARQDMMLKINLLDRHVEKDIEAFKNSQKKEVAAMGA